MGKGTNRAYRVVPVEDEPDFGDPPRNWVRVASMAGVWAVVLLGTAWVAPGFASGGGEEETDLRDQPATDEINAASRYLRFGSDGDTDRAEEVLCDDAEPEMTPADLVDLRSFYEEELKGYPEVEVDTKTPMVSAEGYEIDAAVSYISRDGIRGELFTVTVRTNGGSYCVVDAVLHDEDESTGQASNTDLDFLRFIVWDRDTAAAAAIQCPEYSGPTPQELLAAVEAWELEHGDGGTSYAAPTGNEAQMVAGAASEFPYEVVMDGDRFKETFPFNVVVSGSCVLEVSGGEELLSYAQE